MTIAEGKCCFVVPLVWWIWMFSSWRRQIDHWQMMQLWPAYEQADKHPRAYTRYAFSHVELLKGMDLNPNWTCRNQGFLNQNKYCKFGHLQLYSLNLFPFPISLSKVFFFSTRDAMLNLENLFQVQTLLDDHVIKTQTIKGSPYAAEFKVGEVPSLRKFCRIFVFVWKMSWNMIFLWMICFVFQFKLEYAENMLFK